MKTPKKRPTILAISWKQPERMQWACSPYASSDILAYPVFVDEDDQVRLYSGYTEDLTRLYDGLQATCHIGSDHSTDEKPMGCYGVSYAHVGTVSIGRAERMFKTLKSIQSRMERSADRFGREADFCGHLIHFGNAIGAKRAWIAEGKEGIFMPLADLAPIVAAKALDLSIQCRLLVGKYDGTIKVWTTASPDYDGFGTKDLRVCDRFRQVEIDGMNYEWQVTRYRSGNHAVLNQAEYDRERVALVSCNNFNPNTENRDILPG